MLNEKGRVLIWVQKRGYTPALGCRDCGFYYVCPHCGVAFRYYKETRALICPLCGKKEEIDLFCPRCGGVWLEGWGEGVEKVGEEMKKAFSHQQVVVIDSEKEGEAEEPLSSSHPGGHFFTSTGRNTAGGISFSYLVAGGLAVSFLI